MDSFQIVVHGFSAVHTKAVDEMKTEIAARAGVRLRSGAPIFTMKMTSNKIQSEVQIFGDSASLDYLQKKALRKMLEEVLVSTARRHGLRHEFTGALFMPSA